MLKGILIGILWKAKCVYVFNIIIIQFQHILLEKFLHIITGKQDQSSIIYSKKNMGTILMCSYKHNKIVLWEST